jgi:hypothetical protein
MAKVIATATKVLAAPPDQVLAFLRDYKSRPQILTGNYTLFAPMGLKRIYGEVLGKLAAAVPA